MKKILLILTLFFTSMQGGASGVDNKLYLGTEGLMNMYTIYGVPGVSILGGYRWNTFSTEIGFTKLANDDWGQGLRFKSHNSFVDGIYAHPLRDGLELKGSAGLGVFRTKVYNKENNFFYRDREDESSLGFRAGIGLQYKISDSWTADVNYKLQTNCNVVIGYISVFSLGVRYYL